MRKALANVVAELDLARGLSGVGSVSEIGPDLLQRRHWLKDPGASRSSPRQSVGRAPDRSGATPRWASTGYFLADPSILANAAGPRSTPHCSAKPTR